MRAQRILKASPLRVYLTAAALTFNCLGYVASDPQFRSTGKSRQIMGPEVGQLVQSPRRGPSPVRLDYLGRLGFEDLRKGGVAAMSEPAIGKQGEVDDSEFVTTKRKTTNVRRKDGRAL